LYADLQPRTVARDLKQLEEKGFIRIYENGYVSNKEVLFAFMPASNNPKLVNQELFFMHEYFKD